MSDFFEYFKTRALYDTLIGLGLFALVLGGYVLYEIYSTLRGRRERSKRARAGVASAKPRT